MNLWETGKIPNICIQFFYNISSPLQIQTEIHLVQLNLNQLPC